MGQTAAESLSIRTRVAVTASKGWMPVDNMPHFQAFSADELRALRPLLKNLAEQAEEVLERWHQLYVSQCGGDRTLANEEFFNTMSPPLRSGLMALLDSDFEHFGALARGLGEQLAGRGVPFIEVILSLYVCQESIELVCAKELFVGVDSLFVRLCHLHATLVAEGYIHSEPTSSSEPGEALQNDAGSAGAGRRRSFHGLLGASPAMRCIYDRIEATARARGTVLIVGESGTGKELVARAVHAAGLNSDGPFVAVNCSAIPRDLIESELFGHKRGSFSGANVDYLGLFRAAEGGTLFLDEVTEMNPETQSKFLRALQERAVRPVGSITEVPVKVRVIASTNRRPEHAVKIGLLREDLYYRLQANVIEIPPLRERSEDIPLLTSHFIKIFNTETLRAIPVAGIAQDAMAALLGYSWPGNVRELSNAIESAVTFGRSSRIHLHDLPQNLRQKTPDVVPSAVAGMVSVENPATPVRRFTGAAPKTFDETERALIEQTLQIAGHNKTYAAELLQISRKKLYARLVKYGLLNQGRRARRASYVSARSTVFTP
jgi:DNA-binding NtrC family response regulator